MTITDIVNKIYFLTKTNSSSFLASDMLIAINNAYERVASLILTCDGRWQWDDTNYTDFPIATTALVSGQQDYSLATTHLDILGVEIKDTNGNWTTLTPIDQKDIDYAPSATDFMEGNGLPVYYDKLATSVFLYPAPNYSQSASLKIRFQRGPDVFTSAQVTTGTKIPGFNSLYHDLIPLWVSYEYCYANGLPTANAFMNEITRKEESLKEDYALRNKDENLRLRVVYNNPR
jgi:hypothetical protein